MSQQLPIADLKFERTSTPEEEEEISGLAESIKEQGLFHPISVRAEDKTVIFGRKRLLAMILLGKTEIEANLIEGVDGDRQTELSIHENVKRHYIPWYMHCELVEKLHTLRQVQHGVKTGGRPRSGEKKEGWSMQDTAKELEMSLGALSQDLNLARAVRTDPRLKNVKDKETAKRLVKIETRRAEMEADALWEDKALDDIRDKTFCGASAEILSHFPDGIFDLCITDPPWIKYIKKGIYVKDEDTLPVFKEIYRTLKSSAILFAFVGFEDYDLYKKALPGFGFAVSHVPLIWHKTNQGVTYGIRPWEFNRDYELILLAVKGNPVLTVSTNQSSVLSFPPVHPKKLVHPNEKPVDLIERIVDLAAFEGAHILDPFAGSGVVGEVARKMKRHFTMIERDQKHFDAIVKRVK